LFSFLPVITLIVSCSGKEDTHYQEKSDEIQTVEIDQDSIVSGSLPIIDEPYCTRSDRKITDKQLLLFQKQLNAAIKQRDTNLLLSILDSNVVTSYGGGEYGYSDFLRNWSYGDLWKTLEVLNGLGGDFESDTSYRYPYFTVYKNMRGYDKYWRNYPDPYTEYFSVKDTSYLYSDTLKSEVVAKLVNCYVYMNYQQSIDHRSDWLKLTTYKDSLTGFIPKTDVFRTGDYNLIVEKDTLGKWRVTSFAPFD